MWRKLVVIGLVSGLVGGSAGLTAYQTALAAEQEPAAETEMEYEALNVNTADHKALMGLGLDKATADAIVAYRQVNGPFHNEEDLLKVKGMNETKLKAIESKIMVK